MSQGGTYGDHITLQRASEIFNVQFLVVSSLGADASSIISPSSTYSNRNPLLVLGHIAEGHGEHYLSLEGSVSSFVENILEAESEKISTTEPHDYAQLDGTPRSCPTRWTSG